MVKRRGCYRDFPEEKFDKLVDTVDKYGARVTTWIAAQFKLCSPDYCRRVWKVPYVPLNNMHGPGALARYKTFNAEGGDQEAYLMRIGHLELLRANGDI